MKNVGKALFYFGIIVAFGAYLMFQMLENGSMRGSNHFAEIIYMGQFVGGLFALLGGVFFIAAPTDKSGL